MFAYLECPGAFRLVGSIKALHLEAPEFHGIVVACKTQVTFAVIKSFWGMFDLTAVKRIAIDVQNLCAVEGHLDLLAAHFDLFVIPNAYRTQVSMLGADAVIE